MNHERIEEIGLRAIEWIASEQRQFVAMHSATGMTVEDLRRLEEPEMLAACLDFVLSSDSRVLEFCRAASLEPDSVLAARRRLPGGDLPHWT
ncbi:MAG: DUF3572 domain-containing protein [Rhodobacteraceae bacterium]|nr:DUF3572 domain-containing protein [Paracoccaceae bacterium]